MFNNNMVNLQRALWLGSANLINVEGTSVSVSTSYDFSAVLGVATSWQLGRTTMKYTGLYFGSDPTPATKDDYKLGSIISSGLTKASSSALVTGKEADGKYVAIVSGSVQNTGSTPINIYEMGLVVSYKDSSTTNYFMVDRVVLDEPISLQPGEEKIITYKITFNQTLNVADAYGPEA